MAQVFYCKARPQGADLVQLCLEKDEHGHGRIFIGHPDWKVAPAEVDPSRIEYSIINVAVEDSSGSAKIASQRQVSANRNLVNKIERTIGSGNNAYVVLPRPDQGRCYVGRIAEHFRLENCRKRGETYLELRRQQGLGDVYEREERVLYLGDVVQCWPVDYAEPILFADVPGWMRWQVMGRRTAGLIYSEEVEKLGEPTAGEVLEQMCSGGWKVNRTPTLDPAEVQRRLVRWLAPSSFEHLAVDLMQLDNPSQRWVHVGGSGDGGADGLGFEDGGPIRVLQCKYRSSESIPSLAEALRRGGTKVMVAALLYTGDADKANLRVEGTFLGVSWFAEKVIEHRKRLPLAISLGITD